LSNPYAYSVKGVLTFKNSPQKRAFHALQPDTINVLVNGNGWDMLFSKMNIENKSIPVDLGTLDNKNYIVLSSQLDRINKTKEINQAITGFNPDTLYFDFSNRKEKRIPVRLITSLKYQKQFFQSNYIQIKPSYVVIDGPANVIDHISEWYTDTLRADSVDESLIETVALRLPSEGNLNVYPKKVSVTIPVDEYTEKSLDIPVKLINNHTGEVKIFPQRVRVTFNTSLTKYPDIDEDFFEATADLNLWSKGGYKILPVVISKVPPFCKIVGIEPANIDFIIKK